MRPFAWHRVARIAGLLGEGRVDAAVDLAYEEFRKELRQETVGHLYEWRQGTVETLRI